MLCFVVLAYITLRAEMKCILSMKVTNLVSRE